jgi:Na+/proline symporter
MAKPVVLSMAFALGAVFPLIFFYSNDPDRAELSSIAVWFIAILLPAALVISAISKKAPRLAAVIMLAGFFVGTCIAIVVFYPNKASLFPIASAIYTIMAGIPVALGSVLGVSIARIMNKRGIR